MFNIKDIIQEDNPKLREIAKEVNLPLNEEDKKIMRGMHRFLIDSHSSKNNGKMVGIAAPQLNKNRRIIAIHVKGKKRKLHSFVLANPKLLYSSRKKYYYPNGEACLSVKDKKRKVARSRYLVLQGYDVNNKLLTINCEDKVSALVQHEIDHLNGILYADYSVKRMWIDILK